MAAAGQAFGLEPVCDRYKDRYPMYSAGVINSSCDMASRRRANKFRKSRYSAGLWHQWWVTSRSRRYGPRESCGEGEWRGFTGRVHGHDASDTTVIGCSAGDCSWLRRLTCCRAPPCTDTDHGLLDRVKCQDIGCSLHEPLSLSLGEDEMRVWRLNEVNNMENLFWGNWWREATLQGKCKQRNQMSKQWTATLLSQTCKQTCHLSQ